MVMKEGCQKYEFLIITYWRTDDYENNNNRRTSSVFSFQKSSKINHKTSWILGRDICGAPFGGIQLSIWKFIHLHAPGTLIFNSFLLYIILPVLHVVPVYGRNMIGGSQ